MLALKLPVAERTRKEMGICSINAGAKTKGPQPLLRPGREYRFYTRYLSNDW
jgi:hypothetical protein